MFKHYVLTALRHFAKAKAITSINILCLTFGLASFMLAITLVAVMEKPDQHHANAHRTYVVTQRSEFTDAVTLTLPMSGVGIGPLLDADYPQLDYVVRATRSTEVALSSGDVKGFAHTVYADPEFLEVFDFDFLAGDARKALSAPRSAVINDELALRLFGTLDVIGKPLLLNNRETVHITGVMKPPRQPSHMTANTASVALQIFNLLVSIDASSAARPPANPTPDAIRQRMLGFNTFTFVVFKEPTAADIARLRDDLPAFVQRQIPPELRKVALDIRPLGELSSVGMDFATRREQTGITMNGVVLGLGVLVLVVACLNYANLASAQAMTHLKETALRRVVGASYRQIVTQTFLEALCLVLLASTFAAALMPLLGLLLESRMGFKIDAFVHGMPSFWITVALTTLGVAALASSYPALVAARIRPAHALQSGRTPVFKIRALRILVVCQFATASFLFVATRIMDAHSDQLLRVTLPTDDPVVVIANDTREIGLDRRLLQDTLARQPGIGGASAIDVTPGKMFGASTIVSAHADSGAKRTMFIAPTVDYDFFAALRIPVIAGRVFERDRPSDMTAGDQLGNVVVDRAFALELGWTPHDAVGKQIYVAQSGAKDAIGRPRTIVGVVENHTLYPAKFGSAATVYSLDPERVTAVLVRISRADVPGGLRAIDSVWNELVPNVPLKRQFIDEEFAASYRQMSAMSDIVSFLAGFAIVIAAMGLVGIATHAIGQRTHEIGVRKTVGASTKRILVMLLKDFSKPILIGTIIAWPLAFAFAALFDAMYVRKPPVSIAPYLGSLGLCLAVSWLAVLRRAWSAAQLPPAAVLRHE